MTEPTTQENQPMTLTRAATAEAKIEQVRALHSGVHQCGIAWYNPEGKRGASIATQGPCPTLQAIGTDPTQWGDPEQALTGHAAADAGRADLAAAGVDVGALVAYTVTGASGLSVLAAARDAVANVGKPGAGTRFFALQDAIAAMTAADPVMAAVVAAARWTDRYGSAGAPARLSDLSDTIEHLHDAYPATTPPKF